MKFEKNQPCHAQNYSVLEACFSANFSLEALIPYVKFLEEHKNLFFSKTDATHYFERHVIECLEFVTGCEQTLHEVSADASSALYHQGLKVQNMQLADAGTGPGLPGYFFSALTSAPHVALIDSSKRRLGILEKAIAQGHVPGKKITIRYERIDEIKPAFHAITARALAPLPWLLELLSGALLPGGVLLLATTSISRELLESGAPYLGLSRFHVKQPDTWKSGSRKILIAHKTGQPKKGFPRQWKLIKAEIEKTKA